MNYTLDQRGSLYIRLVDGPSTQQTEMADGVVVDLGPEGAVLGLEVLAAWSPFDLEAVIVKFDVATPEAEYLRFVHGAISAPPTVTLPVSSGPQGSPSSTQDQRSAALPNLLALVG